MEDGLAISGASSRSGPARQRTQPTALQLLLRGDRGAYCSQLFHRRGRCDDREHPPEAEPGSGFQLGLTDLLAAPFALAARERWPYLVSAAEPRQVAPAGRLTVRSTRILRLHARRLAVDAVNPRSTTTPSSGQSAVNRRTGVIESVFLVYPASEKHGPAPTPTPRWKAIGGAPGPRACCGRTAGPP